MIDLKPACHQVVELLAGIADDQLSRPTPCTEYTIADLVSHIDQVARATSQPGSDFAPGWRDRVGQHVLALGEAWESPAAWQGTGQLDLPNEVWGRIVVTELVVHGWDLAKATGQPFDLPADTLRACLDHVAEFVPNAPVPGLWGPPVEVASDAPLIDQIVAITGRVP